MVRRHQTPDWDVAIQRLEQKLSTFSTDTDIDKARQQISNNCYVHGVDNQGVYTLSVPTGGGKTLASLRDYFLLALTQTQTELTIVELDEGIVKTLMKQRQLAKESKGERLGIAFDPKRFMQSLYAEREMLRAITFMHQALNHAPNLQAELTKLPAWDAFQKPIVDALEVIIRSLKEDRYTHHHINIPNTLTLKRAADALAWDEKTQLNLEGLIFSADILTSNLKKLAELFHIRTPQSE